MRQYTRNLCVWTVLGIFFMALDASPIRTKRGYDDNFKVLLNLYKLNPLKQSNVFKSFSDRILLPRPTPDSNDNAKESGEEKKVNTTKEIDSTTNVPITNTDRVKDDINNQDKGDKAGNDSKLFHDLSIKLDTMSAEIMNILDLLQDNNTQSRRQEIKDFNNQYLSQNEEIENKSNVNTSANRLQDSFNIKKIIEVEKTNQRADKFQKQNVTHQKIPNFERNSLDSLNYIPENRSQNQYLAQNGKISENNKNMPKYRNKTLSDPTSVPEFKFYSEDYLRNTIFYDDYFDNDRAYKVQDNEIVDKDKYVNAEVVIF